ncbi:MAG TPA: UDP-N-acetylglucosamine 2-epimerase (non-hydrolyzing), partial [Actinomycetota bacterium]
MLLVIGTRPEAIKLAPVVLVFRSLYPHVETRVALTSQHATLAIGALERFGIVPDVDLAIMSPAQSPTLVAALVLQHMEGL